MEIVINDQFKYLKCIKANNEYVVCLVDLNGHDIVRGFGISIVEAFDDMHSCLV